MRRFTITDQASSYRKISKVEAKKLLSKGLCVAVCPCKLRPGYPWAPHIVIDHNSIKEVGLDKYLTNFIWYNCTHETGYYPSFYEVTSL